MAARDWKIGDKLICMSDRYGRVCPRGFESVITGQCLGDGGDQIGWYSTDAIGSPSAMTYEAYDENFVPKADALVNPEVAHLQARVAELEGTLRAVKPILEWARNDGLCHQSAVDRVSDTLSGRNA